MSGTPAGTVSFTSSGVALCTTPALAAGKASCATTTTPVGVDTVTGTYHGQGGFQGSTGTTTVTGTPKCRPA